MRDFISKRTLNNVEKLRIKIINMCPHINLKGLGLNDLQRLCDVLLSQRINGKE